MDQGIEKIIDYLKTNSIYFFSSSELKARAKRWDEKHLDALRTRKDKLFDEYKEQQKKKRREAELINARLVENF